MGQSSDRALPGGFIALICVVALLVIVAVWSRLSAPDVEAVTTTLDFTPASTTSLPSLSTTTTPTPDAELPADPLSSEAPGWSRLDPGFLGARTDFVVLPADDRVVVWGGIATSSGDEAFGQYYRFGGWSNMAPSPVEAGRDPVTVWADDEMFVYSGAAAAWNPDSNTWRNLAYPATGTSAIAGHPVAGVWTDDEVILIGNETHPPTTQSRLFAVTYGSDLGCCRVLDDPPDSLAYGQAFWTGDEVILIGGLVNDLGGANSEVEVLSPVRLSTLDVDSGSWTTHDTPDWLEPSRIEAIWTGESLMVVDRNLSAGRWTREDGWEQLPGLPIAGGNCEAKLANTGTDVYVSFCDRMAAWSEVSNRWTQIVMPQPGTGFPELGCEFIADPTVFDRVAAWCSDGFETSFWTLDTASFEAGRWSTQSLTDGSSPWELLPNPAADNLPGTTLVASDSELLWFGGHGVSKESYGGWGYDHRAAVLHRIPYAPYPGRFGQAAVWTDSEMIIFRGPTTAWNPIEQTWRVVADAAPAPLLVENGVVWTGSEVVFIGRATRTFNGGTALDPTTDQWRDLPTSPLASWSDSGIAWSGERIYVLDAWKPTGTDGTKGEQRLLSYDPESNAWELLPAIPQQLNISSAATGWVNGEFIAVGANWVDFDRSGPLESAPFIAGAAYSPDTGRWREIALPRQPTLMVPGIDRSLTAVAHGDRLAVIFPALDFDLDAAIGFYDPRRNTWEYIEGAPSPSADASLVSGFRVLAYLAEGGTALLHTP